MFHVPDMSKVLCTIWSGPIGVGPYPGVHVLRLDNVPCNLQGGRRGLTAQFGEVGNGEQTGQAYLLVAPRTDLRDPLSASQQDLVEVPKGSGSFYQVLFVGDVGRGYPNEFRFGILDKIQNATPMG